MVHSLLLSLDSCHTVWVIVEEQQGLLLVCSFSISHISHGDVLLLMRIEICCHIYHLDPYYFTYFLTPRGIDTSPKIKPTFQKRILQIFEQTSLSCYFMHHFQQNEERSDTQQIKAVLSSEIRQIQFQYSAVLPSRVLNTSG